MQTSTRLTPHQRRALAVAACVDPRTLNRYLLGLPVRSTCAARIEWALADFPEGPAIAAGREAAVWQVSRR